MAHGMSPRFLDKHLIAVMGETITVSEETPISAIKEAIRSATCKSIFKLGTEAQVRSIHARAFTERELSNLSSEIGAQSLPAANSPNSVNGLEDDSDVPAVTVLNQVLGSAINRNASDIHFEPTAKGIRCRARIDGRLVKLFESEAIPYHSLVSRVKVLARMNMVETNRCQDGSFNFFVGDKSCDLRVSTVPLISGERMVIRLHDSRSAKSSLRSLGATDRFREELSALAKQPHGLVLICGPTGSGKSTTVFKTLELPHFKDRSVISVEDPIEYRSQSISQIPVNDHGGLTFEDAFKAVVRQDPDVVFVGEIRDRISAASVVKASLAGRLVFSTIHASSSLKAINRLVSLGVDRGLLASAISGIVSQRLVRTLCRNCCRQRSPSHDEIMIFNRYDLEPPSQIAQAVGCDKCTNGYMGRSGVFSISKRKDIMIVEENCSNCLDPELEMLESSILIEVSNGITDISEFLSVVGQGNSRN